MTCDLTDVDFLLKIKMVLFIYGYKKGKQTISFLFYKVLNIESAMQKISLLCRRKSSRHCKVSKQYFKFCSYRKVSRLQEQFSSQDKYEIYIFFPLAK